MDFWNTLDGIRTRLENLAHMSTWFSLAQNTIESSSILGLYTDIDMDDEPMLVWTTESDDQVCEECESLEGEYYLDDMLPDMPVHVNCRCSWELT